MPISAVTAPGKISSADAPVLVDRDDARACPSPPPPWRALRALPSTTKSRSRMGKPPSMSRIAPPVRNRFTLASLAAACTSATSAVLVRVQVALQHEHVVAHRGRPGRKIAFRSASGYEASGTRMMVVQRFAQSGPHDVRIDLRRRDVGMPQHGLHAAQVRPAFQQMRGEAVPEHVRASDCGKFPPCLP